MIDPALSLVGVFTASLLGSAHCAGMCGPLAAVATAPVQVSANRSPVPRGNWWHASGASALSLSAIYNTGRLLTYALLGALAGAVGKAFDFGGQTLGIQRTAAMAAGAMLLAIGVLMLLEHFGVMGARLSIPAPFRKALHSAHTRVNRYGPATRALTIGMLTAFLPCGWLYAFVVAAAGTASPVSGALLMLAFWLGTLPVMTAVGAGVHTLLAPVRRFVPVLTALALIAVGIWSVAWRSSSAFASSAQETQPGHCPLCDLKEKP